MIARVTIDELFRATRESLGLELRAGRRGLTRSVQVPRVQKPGLALAGYLPQIHPDRIQVLGNTEISYLATLPRARARAAARTLLRAGVACVIVTNGAPFPAYLRDEADRAGVTLLLSRLRSAELIRGVTVWLERRLAPQTQLHGALLEVLHLGALILGKSGIGKSEAAIDLVSRGHRLVADDVVVVRREGPTQLVGSSPRLLGHHIEIRGLGIADVAALFGPLATLDEAPIDLVLELEETDLGEDIERLGLEEGSHRILEVERPLVRIPVRPGRPIAALVEVAVRNQVLKRRGVYSAREFSSRLDALLAARGAAGKKSVRRDG
ncbi:MAG: HPr(Ser) kinase/phosphatase [Deltaproteobacteria bacterium]|nr:HPr(Ser) kinase/phosphatase [Deltaproteobacteria bacterium]